MRAATDDGEQLFVEESGNGDPVLLVQGLGYASWAWREQAPLAEHVRLIAFDNRGAGRSSKPETGYSMARMASDAVTVLEAIGGPPAHVMGVSMGGYIAQMLALQRPDLVRSLILVSTSAGGSSYYPIPETTREKWLAASDLPPAEYARATMRLSFAPGWVEAHTSEYEGWLEARLEYPTPAACWREQFAACEEFLDEGAPVEQIADRHWLSTATPIGSCRLKTPPTWPLAFLVPGW